MAASARIILVVRVNHRIPVCGGMTFGALGIIVMVDTRGCMTGITLVIACMIKNVIRPGCGVVALGTIIPIVVRRSYASMALDTVVETRVIESVICPRSGVMT